MTNTRMTGRTRRLSRAYAYSIAAIASTTLLVSPAVAESEGAKRILKSMADYMAAQKNLSARFDVGLEIVTPTIEKIQFAASGNLLMSRPDKLRIRRNGGYSDVELIYNGKTATVVDRDANTYASLNLPGSVDSLVDRLRTEYFIEMPGADLLLAGTYDELMRDVVEEKYVGSGVINGVECYHLAFRGYDTDWQIWIRTGDKPFPCKYVITSKTVSAAPAYTVQFYDWTTNASEAGDSFTYKAASGAKSVRFNDLANIGELPPPAPFSVGEAR